MVKSPGILFWILSLASVVSAIITVTSKRALVVAVSLVVLILAVMNLLILLGVVGVSFVYALCTLLVLVAITFSLYKSGALNSAFTIESRPKPIFYFIISLLFYIACLFLISQTDIWQYASEQSSLSFFDLIGALKEKYLLPFLLFKAFLLVMLIIVFFNTKRKTA